MPQLQVAPRFDKSDKLFCAFFSLNAGGTEFYIDKSARVLVISEVFRCVIREQDGGGSVDILSLRCAGAVGEGSARKASVRCSADYLSKGYVRSKRYEPQIHVNSKLTAVLSRELLRFTIKQLADGIGIRIVVAVGRGVKQNLTDSFVSLEVVLKCFFYLGKRQTFILEYIFLYSRKRVDDRCKAHVLKISEVNSSFNFGLMNVNILFTAKLMQCRAKGRGKMLCTQLDDLLLLNESVLKKISLLLQKCVKQLVKRFEIGKFARFNAEQLVAVLLHTTVVYYHFKCRREVDVGVRACVGVTIRHTALRAARNTVIVGFFKCCAF